MPVGVGVDARQGLGVVAVDIDRAPSLRTSRQASSASSSDMPPSIMACHRAGVFTADRKHLLFEHFAGAVLRPRDEGGDRPGREGADRD
jgi:hypothetical protein